ncbi:MAG: ComEA family DNA-binding protein [Chloroflexi bacterium]|nr:ComEA family DNA-binding protein [Chloroflexota bacterium]
MKTLTQITAGIATVAAIAGGIFLLLQGGSAGGVKVMLPTPTPEVAQEIRVYISGAVHSPGVYTVSDDDRMVEVVAAAGGALADADLNAVNLAARVKDEDHLHVPRIGESPRLDLEAASVAGGRIDINSADARLFQTLPGIGEVKAEAIVRHRGERGEFANVDALLEVKGIGRATLDSIRELIEAR